MDFSLPVFMKENRSRMRGARLHVLLLCLIGAACLGAGIYLGMMYHKVDMEMQAAELFHSTGTPINIGGLRSYIFIKTPYGYVPYNAVAGIQAKLTHAAVGHMSEIGIALVVGVLGLAALLGTLVAPGLAADAFTREREQGTLDFLLLTRLSSFNIVLGKVLSAAGAMLLILLCLAPIAGLTFFFGGVSPGQIVAALAQVLAGALLFTALGVAVSAYCTRTLTAISICYGVAIFWGVVPVLGALAWYMWRTGSVSGPLWMGIFSALIVALVVFNVMISVASVVVGRALTFLLGKQPSREFGVIMFSAAFGMMIGAEGLLAGLLNYIELNTFSSLLLGIPLVGTLAPFTSVMGGNRYYIPDLPSTWAWASVGFDLALTAAAVWMATARVRRLRRG